MGEPDLKDNIADPNHNGATVLRYVWLEPGKAAIFGSDNHLASVQDVETNTKQKVEQQAHAEAVASGPPQRFDPIETPLDYIFYPVKAGAVYFGAGLNCVAGGSARSRSFPIRRRASQIIFRDEGGNRSAEPRSGEESPLAISIGIQLTHSVEFTRFR